MKRFLWMLLFLLGVTHAMTAWADVLFKVTDGGGNAQDCSSVADLETYLDGSTAFVSPITITLQKDVTENETLEMYARPCIRVKIDLNGKTWTSSAVSEEGAVSCVIRNWGGILTIYDSSSGGTGTICYDSDFETLQSSFSYRRCAIDNHGFLEIRSGTVTCKNYNPQSETWGRGPTPDCFSVWNGLGVDVDITEYCNTTVRVLVAGGSLPFGVALTAYTYAEVVDGYVGAPFNNNVDTSASGDAIIRGGVLGYDPLGDGYTYPTASTPYYGVLPKAGYTTKKIASGRWAVVEKEDITAEQKEACLNVSTGTLICEQTMLANKEQMRYRIFKPSATAVLEATLQASDQQPYAILMADVEGVFLQPSVHDNAPRIDLNGYTVNQIECVLLDKASEELKLYGPGRVNAFTSFNGVATIKNANGEEIDLPPKYAWTDANTVGPSAVDVNGVGYRSFEVAIEKVKAIIQGGGDATLTLWQDHGIKRIPETMTLNFNWKTLYPCLEPGVTLTLAEGTLSAFACVLNDAGGIDGTTIKRADDTLVFRGEYDTHGEHYKWAEDGTLIFNDAGMRLSSPTNGQLFVGDFTSAATFSADKEQSTLTLLGDIFENDEIVVPNSKRLFVDLNGYELKREINFNDGDTCGIRNAGLWVFQDKSKEGGGRYVSDPLNFSQELCGVVNTGTFGIEGGEVLGDPVAIDNVDRGRFWIEGGAVRSEEGIALRLKGKGGSEVSGGDITGAHDITQARIRGGTFSEDPSNWVKGAYEVEYDAQTQRWAVGGATIKKASVANVQDVIETLSLSNATGTLSVGTLSLDATGATMLTMDSPYNVVEGSTIMLNGEAVAKVPASSAVSTFALATSSNDPFDEAIEANKKLELLDAAYEVTYATDGSLVLSYDYGFAVEAMTVESTGENRHDVTFSIALREEGALRAETLEKAKLVVYCNDSPVGTAVRKPTFSNGIYRYTLSGVTTDAQTANLFKVRLEPLTEE